MSIATYVPPIPAVTKTVVVTPEQPAKIVLELSLEEAAKISHLLGSCAGFPCWHELQKHRQHFQQFKGWKAVKVSDRGNDCPIDYETDFIPR